MQANGIDPSREDDAIVRAALADIDAFAPLYQRYATPMYRWMYRETGDPDIAADLTAQAFMQALQRLHQYNPQRATSFRAWLFAITKNLLRDSWRRYRPTALPPDLSDASPGPEEIAIHLSLMDDVRAALASLPDRQREIIELRLSGLSMREVAEIQNASENAVKVAQTRAFKTLRTILGQKVTT